MTSARLRMYRGRRLLLVRAAVAALICVVSVGRADAAQDRYGDIEISELDIPTADSWHGYVAYRYTIVNRSTSQPHTVELRLPARAYSPGPHVTRTTTVGPGATATVSLYQPPLGIEGTDVAVVIDGLEKRSIRLRLVGHAQRDDVQVSILATRSQAEPLRQANVRVGRLVHELEVEQSPVGVSQWATNWLGYCRYDVVAVSSDEYAAMPPTVRQAVCRYVACGGVLLITGQMDPPEESLSRRESPYGTTHCAIGFGECIIVPASTEKLSPRAWEYLFKNWQISSWTLSRHMTVSQANRLLPVVENLRIPTGGMFVVMLVFVVVAGPVNLIVLWKFRRRIWMLWTVPAVSLVTCLAVFLYSFLAEGWTGHVRTAALTILDQRNHRAATLGLTGFYSPLTPGDGLHFSQDTEATPQWGSDGDNIPGAKHYGPRPPERRTPQADWSQDQHLRGGWISARVPVHFRIRKAETRRERLNVTVADDGTVTVVNGLGSRIARLVLADANGHIHEAMAIEPGAEAALTASSRPARSARSTTLRRIRTFFAENWMGMRKNLIDSPGDFLLPNSYIAELDGAPFVETALAGAEHEKSRSVVYGIIGGDGGS